MLDENDSDNRISEYVVETVKGEEVEKIVHRFEYLKWTEQEKSSEEKIYEKINSDELVLREKILRSVINDSIFIQKVFDASDNEIFSEVLEMTNDSTYRETKSKTVVKTEKYEPNHNCVIEKEINGYFYQQETIISDDEKIELIKTTKTNVDGSREETEYMNIMNEEKRACESLSVNSKYSRTVVK